MTTHTHNGEALAGAARYYGTHRHNINVYLSLFRNGIQVAFRYY